MADKQTDADKAAAMKEYRDQHNAAVDRIAALRAARLAKEATDALTATTTKTAKPKKQAGVLKAKTRR